jgi:hypothetical protein
VIVSPQKLSETPKAPAPAGLHRKDSPDLYTVLLVIALVAVLIGILFLYLEMADYDFNLQGAPPVGMTRDAGRGTGDEGLGIRDWGLDISDLGFLVSAWSATDHWPLATFSAFRLPPSAFFSSPVLHPSPLAEHGCSILC